MHWILLAWRNVFRNLRRTLLSGIIVGIGLAALMFMDGLMLGMFETMIDSATSSFLGHAQIHQKGFRLSHEVEKTIEDLDEVEIALKESPMIERHTLRTQAFAMVSSAMNVSSIALMGVEPESEAAISKLDDFTVKGAFLSAPSENQILLGTRLAELLEVGLGDRIVVTLAQANTGELFQELFRLSGIFTFNSKRMDTGMAFIHIQDMQRMLNLPKGAHEIALRFTDRKMASNRELPLWATLERNQNEALGWRELMPSLSSALEMSKYSIWIMGAILFGIVALGIMNTLFMSIHERMFEFGVMKAIGTRSYQVALLILLEAFSIGIVSCAIGVALGFAFTYYYSIFGFDFTGIEYAGVTFQEPIRTAIQSSQFTYLPFLVLVLTVCAAIYPAIFASRIVPAEAMRKSL